MSVIASLFAVSMAVGTATIQWTETEPAPQDGAPVFAGEFRFIGGPAQRSHVAAAVERAVQALLPMFHGLARKRLTRANRIPQTISMTMIEGELEIRYGDLKPMRAPLDGSLRHWHNREGTRVKLTHELRGATLVQTTWGGGGRRVVKWRFDSKGRLRIHSTMSSGSLPVPVEYRLTFDHKASTTPSR